MIFGFGMLEGGGVSVCPLGFTEQAEKTSAAQNTKTDMTEKDFI